MFAILAHIRPLNPATGERIDVRVASLPGSGFQGVGNKYWEAAISRRPRAAIELFALDLSPGVRTATADMEISMSAVREVDLNGLYWAGAPVIVYRADNLAWPAPIEFEGVVSSAPSNSETDRLVINMRVSVDDIDKPLLVSEFTGGRGIGGDPEMRGTLKPAGFGNCKNVEPVMFDKTRNIALLDGYGNLIGVDWLGEGLSDFGPSVGDYADYNALAAAIDTKVIPPGRWGTSISSGLIGLGAPPVGVITCHARFRFGRTGALIRRICVQHAGLSIDRIETGSLTALDAAVPFPIHYWTAEQITVKSLVEALAAGCNASPVMTFQNRLAVIRPFGGATIGRFSRYGFSEPAVTAWKSADPLTPYWQTRVRVARPVRVLSTDEVNYEDDIINRGVFDVTETYRQGNTVWTDDGAQWIYINATAAAGHVPPRTTGIDAYWRQLKEQTNAQVAEGYRVAAPIVDGASYTKGDIGSDQGAKWIYTADLVWDGTKPPLLPAESNAFWSLVKDAQTVALRTNITSISIKADYQNKPIDGQLPLGGRGILSVGSVVVTTGITWTVTPSGCDAVIDADGAFAVTAVRTNGYVDVNAVYGDRPYTARVSITLSASAPPAGDGGDSGGGGGPVSSITSFPSVSSTTYPTAPAVTAFANATAGGIKFDGTLNYSASSATGKVSRSAVVFLKVVYRVKDSGAGWTDAGPEIEGSEAVSGGFPDYESYDGSLAFDGLVVTGLVAGTAYEFGVLLRRTGNSPTQPYGAVNGGGA